MTKTIFGAPIGRRAFLQYTAAGAAAGALGTVPAFAATDYPTRPVTVIVPYSAGGNTDTMARLACNYLTQKHGISFVVENQPTAGGVVGTETVARADADGYTLLFGAATMIIIRPILQELNYDDSSFAPVSILGTGPYILGIRSSLPPTNLEEFIAYAKENPGTINYASAGTGGNAHLTTAKFSASAEIDIVEIPYPGGGPASTAFAGGEVDMYFGNASEMMRLVDNPDIRLLAVSSPERMAALPDLPALAEVFENFRATSWNGFLAPAGTPQEIIDIIEQGTMEAARDPEISARLTSLGILPVGSSAAELAEIIEQDKVFYGEAIEIAGLTVE
jgi:tripartite-type tricarboxylate transporter receptor subunit TctC